MWVKHTLLSDDHLTDKNVRSTGFVTWSLMAIMPPATSRWVAEMEIRNVEMKRVAFFVLLAFGATGLLTAEPSKSRQRTSMLTRSPRIEKILKPIHKKYDLPALGAAVIRSRRKTEAAVVGVRKYGTDVQATINDKFHIGSCTKAMTATQIAVLVEQKKLRWDTTIGQSFLDLKDSMHPSYGNVTLTQLLSHRGGFPEQTSPKGKTLLQIHRLPGTSRKQRAAYVQMMLEQPPEAEPGSKYIYSNAGYSVVGAIAERVTDKSWEDLVTEMVFRPLKMTSTGFGAMGTSGKIVQPWQHRLEGSKRVPVGPGPLSDNPPAISPAGRVHCSIADWAKYIAAHLDAGRGRRALLKPATFKKLHTPVADGDYSLGWNVTERKWGGGQVLTHAGSNTMNYAVVWIAPKRNFAVLAVTNLGGELAFKACDEAVYALIRQTLTKRGR